MPYEQYPREAEALSDNLYRIGNSYYLYLEEEEGWDVLSSYYEKYKSQGLGELKRHLPEANKELKKITRELMKEGHYKGKAGNYSTSRLLGIMQVTSEQSETTE